MSSKVGTRGQVVISKEIRERLGIESGWIALQQLVDDHVEIYFVPPEHNRSLRGSLAKYTNVRLSAEEWAEARQNAWEQAAKEKFTS